jgi:hypothetical protein
MSVSIGELFDRSPALRQGSPGVTRLRGAGLTLHRQGHLSKDRLKGTHIKCERSWAWTLGEGRGEG